MLPRSQDYKTQRSARAGTTHILIQSPLLRGRTRVPLFSNTPNGDYTQGVLRCAWNSWLCEPLLCEHRWHVCVRQGVCPHPSQGPQGGERLAVGQLPGLQVLSAACSVLGAGHLPGCRCCSGKGDIIHQGDKAADERWASEQLFLSSSWNGCWRRGGKGKRGKAHSEIKNDGPAGG